jgi:hypothetical protein
MSQVSWVEIKPASKGRNDPASGACIRPHEKRGIFLSNRPDINELKAGLFGRKMPTYADFGGWVISTLAGWLVVTADTKSNLRHLLLLGVNSSMQGTRRDAYAREER